MPVKHSGITVEDITNIVFQRDDRITKDALRSRGALQRVWDNVVTTQKMSPFNQLDTVKSFFVAFDKQVEIEQAHPRALSKALLELRSLGFNNQQVNFIGDSVKDFMFVFTHEYYQMNNRFGRAATARHNHAFLGTAFQSAAGVLDHIDFNGVFKNEVTDAASDPIFYKGLQAYLRRDVDRAPQLFPFIC